MAAVTRTPDEMMSEMRRRGMSTHAIATAGEVMLGWQVGERHVRQRLFDLGFEKNQNKARALTAMHAKRRAGTSHPVGMKW